MDFIFIYHFFIKLHVYQLSLTQHSNQQLPTQIEKFRNILPDSIIKQH